MITKLQKSQNFSALQVGGKAFNLGILLDNNVQIPPTYIIPTSIFEKFKKENNITSLIENLSFETLFEISENIQTIFEISKVKAFLEKEDVFKNAPDELTTVAVRSSANVEDSKEASFAGQFESVLNVDFTNRDLLIIAVKVVWESAFSTRALAYSLANNVDISKIEMAVIIQEMIDAKAAGTSFTKDMETNDKNTIMLQAVEGIGDSIVDGTADETTYKIEKKDLSKILTKGKQLLSASEITDLAKLSLGIEELYRSEQDIEWAIDKEGKLWILQTRAITT